MCADVHNKDAVVSHWGIIANVQMSSLTLSSGPQTSHAMGDMQEDEGLAEEVLAMSQRWRVLPNWHVTAALIDIYVANGRPEKAIAFINFASEAVMGGGTFVTVSLLPCLLTVVRRLMPLSLLLLQCRR